MTFRLLVALLLSYLPFGSYLLAQAPSFTSDNVFNEASFSPGAFASESLVSLWGSGLATAVVVPEDGLQPSIDGTTVVVTDAAETAHPALLRFVAPRVLSFLAPAGMTPGPGVVTVSNSAGRSGSADVLIQDVSPGLYAANEVGEGPALATFLRVPADGSREEGIAFIRNATAGTRSSVPIQFGSPAADVYLSLWGTGFRNASEVTVRIGGLDVALLAAVAQSEFPGLDQAVLGPLPHELMNQGEQEIEFLADAVAARPLTLSFLENPADSDRIVYQLNVAVDQAERLVIRGNQLQWIHVGNGDTPPDDQWTLGASIQTRVAGVPAIAGSWSFRWPEFPPEAGSRSSTFDELWPPLPQREVQVMMRRTDVPDRGSVRLMATPTAANDYSLVLEFYDRADPEPTRISVLIEFTVAN